MNNIKQRIAVLPWPDKENCFLCVSGSIGKKTNYGDKWYLNAHDERVQKYNSEDFTNARITFAYRLDNVAAEWDGEYGPIQLWFKTNSDYVGSYGNARPHWLFDYA